MDCTQKQFEQLMHALNEKGIDSDKFTTQAEYDGALVQEAVNAGWLQLDVDNAPPKEVAKTAREIRQFINDVYDVSPNE